MGIKIYIKNLIFLLLLKEIITKCPDFEFCNECIPNPNHDPKEKYICKTC